MKYSTPLVTPPIPWTATEFQIPIKNIGDTLFITPIQQLDRTLKLETPDTPDKTRQPHVRVVQSHKGILDQCIEGEDLTLTVALSEVSATDIVVDLTVTHNGLAEVQREWRQSGDVEHFDDTFDYLNTYFVNAADADYASTAVQITIPAGQLQASTTLTTVDDTTLQRGEGSFKVSKATITAQDNPNYVIHHNYDSGLLLVEDSSAYPKWEGSVEVWGRMGELCEYEPIIDPDTSTTVTLDFGWNMSDDGLSVESFTGTTKIIDDIPVESLMLKIPEDIPTDINVNDPVDLTTIPPNFRIQIVGGYRYA